MTVAPARRNIPALTGLRGVAAVWVVLFHLLDKFPIIQRGYLGVDVFFLLSGYVLAHVYAGKLRLGSRDDYIAFLRTRLARIYPLHVVTLGVLALIVLTLPGFAAHYPFADQRWSPAAFVASLALVQNWAYFLPTSWNTPAWSLSAEWFAYLAFPLFLLTTQWPRSKTGPLALAAALLCVLTGVFLLRGIADPSPDGTPGMLRMVCEFAGGCLLYRAVANGIGRLPVAADIVAVALVLIGTLGDGALVYLALPGFAATVLLAALESPTARFLALRPVVFLGEISYSIYLIHWIVIQLSNWLGGAERFAGWGGEAVWNAAVILVCVGLATLSYRWIEGPARAWSRRQAKAARDRTAATAPAAFPVLRETRLRVR